MAYQLDRTGDNVKYLLDELEKLLAKKKDKPVTQTGSRIVVGKPIPEGAQKGMMYYFPCGIFRYITKDAQSGKKIYHVCRLEKDDMTENNPGIKTLFSYCTNQDVALRLHISYLPYDKNWFYYFKPIIVETSPTHISFDNGCNPYGSRVGVAVIVDIPHYYDIEEKGSTIYNYDDTLCRLSIYDFTQKCGVEVDVNNHIQSFLSIIDLDITAPIFEKFKDGATTSPNLIIKDGKVCNIAEIKITRQSPSLYTVSSSTSYDYDILLTRYLPVGKYTVFALQGLYSRKIVTPRSSRGQYFWWWSKCIYKKDDNHKRLITRASYQCRLLIGHGGVPIQWNSNNGNFLNRRVSNVRINHVCRGRVSQNGIVLSRFLVDSANAPKDIFVRENKR